jgi:hypothetical protein
MSYTYLINLYEFIDKRMQEAKECSQKETAGSTEAIFQKSRLATLRECRQFLVDHYNHKLPRRLQSKYLR